MRTSRTLQQNTGKFPDKKQLLFRFRLFLSFSCLSRGCSRMKIHSNIWIRQMDLMEILRKFLLKTYFLVRLHPSRSRLLIFTTRTTKGTTQKIIIQWRNRHAKWKFDSRRNSKFVRHVNVPRFVRSFAYHFNSEPATKWARTDDGRRRHHSFRHTQSATKRNDRFHCSPIFCVVENGWKCLTDASWKFIFDWHFPMKSHSQQNEFLIKFPRISTFPFNWKFSFQLFWKQ